MKTVTTYIIEIRKKYELDKSHGKLNHNLYHPSPGDVHKICLRLFDDRLSQDDDKIMSIFFALKSGELLRDKMKKYDIDGFRPVCNFLKGKTEVVKDSDTIELIALLVDFNPRPYSRYRTGCTLKINSESGGKNDITKNSDELGGSPIKEGTTYFKKAWIAFLVLIVGNLIYIRFINKEEECMVWVNDHFERSECSGQALEIELNLAELKELKKIEVCDTTTFFRKYDPIVWYDKFNGEIEFFTHYGINPMNGRTLKPITKTIIKNHVKPCADLD